MGDQIIIQIKNAIFSAKSSREDVIYIHNNDNSNNSIININNNSDNNNNIKNGSNKTTGGGRIIIMKMNGEKLLLMLTFISGMTHNSLYAIAQYYQSKKIIYITFCLSEFTKLNLSILSS